MLTSFSGAYTGGKRGGAAPAIAAVRTGITAILAILLMQRRRQSRDACRKGGLTRPKPMDILITLSLSRAVGMFNRRTLLRVNLAAPFLGAWFERKRAAAATLRRDFFKELNVRGFINAAEPFTALSGSLM